MHVVKVKLGLIGIIAFFRRGEKRQINKRPIQYLDFQHAAQFSPGINYDWTGIGLIVGQGLSDRLQIIRLDNKINMTEVSIIIILVQLGVNKIRRGTQTHNICGSRNQVLPRENCVHFWQPHTKTWGPTRSHTDTLVSTHEDCQTVGSVEARWKRGSHVRSRVLKKLQEISSCCSSVFPTSDDDNTADYIYIYIHTHTQSQSRQLKANKANYTSVIRKCMLHGRSVDLRDKIDAHTADLSHIWFSWSFNVSERAGSTLEKANAWKPLAHELVKLSVYM